MKHVLHSLALAALFCGCPRSTIPGDDRDADAAPDVRVGRRDARVPDADFDVFVDPGCDAGDVQPSPGDPHECDPRDTGSCGPGMACYPTTVYPQGECGEEVFGSVCAPAGRGGQGDPCMSAFDCEAGYTCFVTGEGDQCLRLCDLGGGEPRCPRGRICAWTDNPEHGACF
jgi:hypothetical protein